MQDNLNAFAALPRTSQKEVRFRLTEYLGGNTFEKTLDNGAIPLHEVQNHYPMKTSNFSDFYCSLEHTENVRLNYISFFCELLTDLLSAQRYLE